MESRAHDQQPQASPTRSAIQATLHCLTGCAIGEILGMAIATWLALANLPSVVISIAIALAFVFGYALTFGPIIRAVSRSAGPRTRSRLRRWSVRVSAAGRTCLPRAHVRMRD
jgi:hypothetical protein